MIRAHFSSPRVVAKPCKLDAGHGPSPQRPQYPHLYRQIKQRLGCSLRASVYKKSVVRQRKKATQKYSRVEGGISGPRFEDQCQNQTVLVAMDNSTKVAYINKQRGTHSAEM